MRRKYTTKEKVISLVIGIVLGFLILFVISRFDVIVEWLN